MTTDPIIITADEVAAILRLSPRSLEKRHTWSPKFPAPLTRRPLTWTRSSVLAWIDRRDRMAQAKAA